MGANEFGNKPPDAPPPVPPPVAPPKDRQAEIDAARTKFGLNGQPRPADHPAPRVADATSAAPRRLDPERALDLRLPPGTTQRDGYDRSQVRELEKSLAQQGYKPDQIEGLRQELRAHPELCTAGGPRYAEVLHDFARAGTVPPERYVQPKSPEVDALVHKAVGKQAGDYVSQRDLDGLLKSAVDHRGELIRKGLTEIDIDRVRNYLVRETGRVPTPEFAGDKRVTTSDGHLNLTEADAARHDRWRMVDATVEAPLTTGWARAKGAELDEIERRAHTVSTLEQLVGAWVLHTATVRAGIATAERPAGPPRIVPESPATPGKLAPERSGGPPDSGSYAKELFNIRDRAYELALNDARQAQAEHGQEYEYDATGFGRRVHVHFGNLANQSVREGRLPESFVVNEQNKVGQKYRGLDAWDKTTGVGFDVTTATTKSVLSHEKHVGVPTIDNTHIGEYLPLVYPSFKETKKTLGYK